MALGKEQDFSMHSGDDRVLEITIRENDHGTLDITGAAITWALSRIVTDKVEPKGAAIVTKTVGSGITITNAHNGHVEVAITETDTDDLAGTYYHEMQLVLSGDTSTVMYGTVTIKKDLI